MSVGPGWGVQAGTRIQGKAEKKISEYVVQALVGASAANVFVACILVGWSLAGWQSTPIAAGLLGIIFLLLFWFLAHPQARYTLEIASAVWLAVVVVSGIFSHWLWDWFFSPTGWEGIGLLLSVFAFPRWVWATVIILYLPVAIKWRIKRTWIIFPFAIVSVAVLAFDDWTTFLPALNRIRYMLLPFIPAVAFFAIVLTLVLSKELMWPNMEWTLKPLQMAELREIGLIGLWLPRLVTKWIKSGWKPTVRRVVELWDHNGGQTLISDYDETDEVRDFFFLLLAGHEFTNRTAEEKAGLTRKQYENIRDLFLRHAWVKWKDDENHKLGLVLTGRGERKLRDLCGLMPSPTPDAPVGESA